MDASLLFTAAATLLKLNMILKINVTADAPRASGSACGRLASARAAEAGDGHGRWVHANHAGVGVDDDEVLGAQPTEETVNGGHQGTAGAAGQRGGRSVAGHVVFDHEG